MKKIILKHNSSLLFNITLCLAMICWLFLFMQLINSHIFSAPQKAIPAFQSIANSNLQVPPDKNSIYALLKEYDPDICLVSCQIEKNYTDLYFYSPVIQQRETKITNKNYNLQAAITKTHVYFGSPFIQYDF